MSVDIDWESLRSPTYGLARKLVETLNQHLESASRPSFIGPIKVTDFNFGSIGPAVEITDVRDVWRAFEDADAEGDQVEISPSAPTSTLDDEVYDVISTSEARDFLAGISEDETLALDNTSIYSGLASPRHSVGVVGMGMGFGPSALHFGIGRDYASAMMSTQPAQRNLSLFSQPHPRTRSVSRYPLTASASRRQHSLRTNSPVDKPREGLDNAPSLQVHLRLSHRSNVSLTLLTSLSINYPSPSFMSLPLRLTVTSFTVRAEIILAYSSEKRRLYVTLLNDDGGSAGETAGERVLPYLNIESEIGHTDAHVMKNVGKVEKFIADVIRKTLMEEVGFPNFQTIAL